MMTWEYFLRDQDGVVQVKQLWLQESILFQLFEEISCKNLSASLRTVEIKSSWFNQQATNPCCGDNGTIVSL